MAMQDSAVPPRPRVLLIDLDNCPAVLTKLPDEVHKFTRIVACYGAVEPRLTLSLVRALAQPIHEGRLEFVGMERGKNAADFGLAYWAGRLVERMPPETEFVVISRDQGLDHVVNLLRRDDRPAQRVGAGTQTPLTTIRVADAADEFYQERLRRVSHQPKRQKTLLKSIRAFFKDRAGIDAQSVFDSLLERGLVAHDGKELLTYPQIEQWAEADSPEDARTAKGTQRSFFEAE